MEEETKITTVNKVKDPRRIDKVRDSQLFLEKQMKGRQESEKLKPKL